MNNLSELKFNKQRFVDEKNNKYCLVFRVNYFEKNKNIKMAIKILMRKVFMSHVTFTFIFKFYYCFLFFKIDILFVMNNISTKFKYIILVNVFKSTRV